MTIAGNQGQNVYPDPTNYPDSSFPQPVPAPSVDPDDAGTLIRVAYSWEWQPVLLAAVDQLRNPATWQGDHDEIITALNRATDLKSQLQRDLSEVETPFWDDTTDVEVSEPDDMQPWYGEVTNPTAPADELDFVENALLWAFTGLIAAATFEVAGLAPAIAFHTSVEKFIILQKRGDTAGQDMKYVNTAPYAPGDLIKTEIITPQTGGSHDLLIIGGSS